MKNLMYQSIPLSRNLYMVTDWDLTPANSSALSFADRELQRNKSVLVKNSKISVFFLSLT